MHEVFYAGGHLVRTEAGTFMSGQMYVERYRPPRSNGLPPVVMVHGTGQSGAGFINNTAGDPGWAADFVRAGFDTMVVDQVGRGRSGVDEENYGPVCKMPLEDVDALFCRTSLYGRFPDAGRHTHWDKAESQFRHFAASQLPSLIDRRRAEELNVDALEQLLLDTGPATLLTHSQASTFGFGVTDRRPDLVAAHVLVEPNGPPFFDLSYAEDAWDTPQPQVERPFGITRLPLTFDPPLPKKQTLTPEEATRTSAKEITGWLQKEPARRLPKLAKVPTAIVTAEASYRSRVDGATSRFLEQAGVSHDHIRLSEHEITGNGHLLMLEPNSSQTAAVLINWIRRAAGSAAPAD